MVMTYRIRNELEHRNEMYLYFCELESQRLSLRVAKQNIFVPTTGKSLFVLESLLPCFVLTLTELEMRNFYAYANVINNEVVAIIVCIQHRHNSFLILWYIINWSN